MSRYVARKRQNLEGREDPPGYFELHQARIDPRLRILV
jgi:hypothetical protein